MTLVYFVTHPDVVIDPAVPVPEWQLSNTGLQRMRTFASQPWLSNVRYMFCSDERKAVDSAMLLADALQKPYSVDPALRENDRSSTGYLPKLEFERTAEEFFTRPERSARGWERAIDAQHRIVSAMNKILNDAGADGDIAVISHGGVGALYFCHLKGIPISPTASQPPGNGGNLFVFERYAMQVLLDWRSID